MKDKIDILLISLLFLAISIFFYFWNLDNWFLWQDEANAALLAKNILKFGYPYVFDSKNLIWPGWTDVSFKYFYWILWGWLPLYFNALIFYLFGATTFTARFSSALTGIIFVQLLFQIMIRIKLPKATAFWSSFMVLFSVLLSLFFRQCGYYAFTVFFSCLMILIYSGFKPGRKRTLYFFLCSLALLNTHLLIWGIVILSITIAILFIERDIKPSLKFAGLNFMMLSPFLYLYQVWQLFERTSYGNKDVVPYWQRFLFYIRSIEISLIPWWFAVILLFCLFYFKKSFKDIEKKILLQSLVLIITTFIFIPLLTRYIYLRYILMIIPIILMSVSIISVRIFQNQRILGILMFIIIIYFNILGFKKGGDNVRFSQLRQFYYELTHKGDDVNKGIVNYLKEHAKSEDTVLCNYGDFPIIFYTDLIVRGGPGRIGAGYDLISDKFNIVALNKPDWIIMRNNWKYLYPEKQFENILKNHSYKKIILDIEDDAWGNRPSIFYHFFITRLVKNPVIIYKLIKS